MAIAGIYATWRAPDGRELYSFAMLTVNADDHPLMKRFHKPGDEKRMVVILDPAKQDEWLACAVSEAHTYFRQWSGELLATPDPLLRAPLPAVSGKVVIPPIPPAPQPRTGDLF